MTTGIVPTVTGYQAFWNNVLCNPNVDPANTFAFPTAAQNGARVPMDKQLARILKRNTYRGMNELFLTLIGAASGSAALAQHKYVDAPTGPSATTPQVTGIGDLGGSRTISTFDDVNRNTTTDDITWISKFFNDKLLEAGITYPTVSGSGGSGKITNGQIRF